MDASLQKVYRDHRRKLAAELDDGLILVASGAPATRNDDVSYVFRQDSNFLYLTGIEAPGYALAMNPKSGREVLFIPRIDQHHKVWLGHVPDLAETRKLFGIREVHYLDEASKVLPKLKEKLKVAYSDEAGAKVLREAKLRLPRKAARYRDALSFLRVVKTPGELELMRHANEVSSAAHEAAMEAARPGMWEYQIQAVLEKVLRDAGMAHNAYPSIVATGTHGAVLHYHHNDAQLRDGDLLLVDAGGEQKGYAADITRTFPVNGKFTARQRDLYEVVLAAQVACIDAMRTGACTADIHRLSQRILSQGMVAIGLMKGDPDDLVESEAIRVFYPHGLGHPLGLDVHDVNGGKRLKVKGPKPKNLRANYRLPAGAVMTVEPGIYFIDALISDPALRKKHKGQIDFAAAAKWLDFGGVRIEDDVVVQPEGPPENLTSAPKTVRDIEAACARGR